MANDWVDVRKEYRRRWRPVTSLGVAAALANFALILTRVISEQINPKLFYSTLFWACGYSVVATLFLVVIIFRLTLIRCPNCENFVGSRRRHCKNCNALLEGPPVPEPAPARTPKIVS